MIKIVHYICFGVDDAAKNILSYYSSAQPKIRYIADTIKKVGFKVNIVSACSINKNGLYFGRSFVIDDFEKHTYFTSFKLPIIFFNKMSLILTYIQLIYYCLFHVKKNDQVLIYHSLYYLRPIRIVQKLKKFNFILEVEELYSCLSNENKRFYQSEINYINTANAYLLVNDLIDEKIERGDKQAIISYGNYTIPKEITNVEFCYKGYINVVYAGVIENIRKAAFIAADSARHLNENYRIHILGFGSDKDIEALRKKICEINVICGGERVIFYGEKSGNEYYGFLQSCDIALSCHTYETDMQESADYTFPSKIITYLANGLRVVSSNIRCVKQSQIGNYISFYDENSVKSITKAIKAIDLTEQYDSTKIVEELDNDFCLKIKLMLQNIA